MMTGTFGMLASLGQLSTGLALGLAGIGSSIGIGLAGRAAAGAWAKEAKAGIGQRFTYIILLGLPLSQTFYAVVLMGQMQKALIDTPQLVAENMGLMLGIGFACGIAEMLSAWMQGMIGAAGIRAINEGQGKGFAFIIIAMGIVETVGIVALVFLLGLIPKAPAAEEVIETTTSMLPQVPSIFC